MPLPRLKEQGISWLVIGNGSNLLVADKGIRGVVIKMGENFADSQWRGLTVKGFGRNAAGLFSFGSRRRRAAGVEVHSWYSWLRRWSSADECWCLW